MKKRSIQILISVTAYLLSLPALAQLDSPELSGDVAAARQALPVLTERFCGSEAHIAEYQTYCHLTSMHAAVNQGQQWVLFGWYEGESSGDAFARFDGKQWQLVYVSTTPYGNRTDAMSSGVPTELAHLLPVEAETQD